MIGMAMARKLFITILVALMVWHAGPVWSAGLTVFDPAVYGQSVLTVANTLTIIENQLKDLMSLAQVGVFLDLIREVNTLVVNLRGITAKLSARAGQWRGFVNPNNLPTTAEGYYLLMQQASMYTFEAAQDAMEAQTFLADAAGLLNSLSNVIGLISGLIGNLQGLQALSGIMGHTAALITHLQTMTAAFHQAASGQMLTQSIAEMASARLTQERFKDWGRMGR